MTVQLRLYDDGAWVHVHNERAVGTGSVWRLADHDLCDCDVAHLLLQGFLDVGVRADDVDARAVGQCIDCGERGTVDWLTVGRIVDGAFRPTADDHIHLPGRDG